MGLFLSLTVAAGLLPQLVPPSKMQVPLMPGPQGAELLSVELVELFELPRELSP